MQSIQGDDLDAILAELAVVDKKASEKKGAKSGKGDEKGEIVQGVTNIWDEEIKKMKPVDEQMEEYPHVSEPIFA